MISRLIIPTASSHQPHQCMTGVAKGLITTVRRTKSPTPFTESMMLCLFVFKKKERGRVPISHTHTHPQNHSGSTIWWHTHSPAVRVRGHTPMMHRFNMTNMKSVSPAELCDTAFWLTVTHRLLWNILDKTNNKLINKNQIGVSHIAYFVTKHFIFWVRKCVKCIHTESIQTSVRTFKTAITWSVKW